MIEMLFGRVGANGNSPVLDVTEALSKPLSARQRVIPSIPVKKSKEQLQQQVVSRLRRLEAQAERINQLSAELELAMIELKSISTQVNGDLRASQSKRRLTKAEICEYNSSVVPHVAQKPSGSLVLTTRPVDLFKQEKEAALTAQELRERTRRKRKSK